MARVRLMQRVLDRFHHPAQVVVGAFAVAGAIGTGLLSPPVAAASGERAGFVDALFTAMSAVCVTGFAIVDPGSHWSGFGQVVILGLMQIGGLGIMTLASLFALLISGRLGLKARLVAQVETKTLRVSDVRSVIRAVVVFSLVSELVIAVLLAGR